jgi:hypothetical protein
VGKDAIFNVFLHLKVGISILATSFKNERTVLRELEDLEARDRPQL